MKGISLSTQRLFNHQSSKKVLEQQSTERAPNYGIASEKHDIFTVRTIKVCLSAYDDKRFIFDDGITSLPFGHYKIVDDIFMREIRDNWDVNMDNTNNSEGAETTLGNGDGRPEIHSLKSSTLGVDDIFMREIRDNWDVNMDNTNNSEGAETTLGNGDERPEIQSLKSSTLGDRSDNSFKETDWGFLQRTYNESEL